MKYKKIFLVVFSFFTISHLSAQGSRSWYVSPNGSNSNSGQKASPLETIKAAIDSSSTGDTIVLDTGKYEENITFPNHKITLASYYVLDGNNAYINKTVLDGSNYYGNNPFINTTNSEFHIIGLKISGAPKQVLSSSNNNNSSIEKCHIFQCGNNSIWGVIAIGGNTLIDHCTFEENYGRYIVSNWIRTAGVMNKITRCVFKKNGLSSQSGGGYASVFSEGRMEINTCLFYENLSACIATGGNGVQDSIIIENNTIVNNKGYGISFENWGGGSLNVLYNNIIYGNKHNLVFNNYSGYSIILMRRNHIYPYLANANVIPSKLYYKLTDYGQDTSSKPSLDKSFRLINSSPLLGYGFDSPFKINSDIEGNARPFPSGSNPDLGAYENAAAFPSPVLVTTEGGDKKITVTWTQFDFTGLSKYKLYRSTKPISDTATLGVVVDTLSSKTLNYTDSGLTNLTRYYYRIKSINSSGLESGFSNELSAIPNTPPDAPDSIRVVNGPHRVQLTWPASATRSVTYTVVRSALGKSDVKFSNLSNLSYEDTSVVDGIIYTYKVCAIDSVGVKSLFTKSKNGRSYRLFFVSSKGSDSIGYGYELKPMKTIQYAIDQSRNGDTILIEKGTYKENVIFRGKEIVLTSRFSITGDKQYIDSTIIDGNTAGCVVRVMNGEGNETEISGLVLQNGYASQGAGLYASAKKLKLKSLIVRNNLAVGDIDGGGAIISVGYLTVDNCIFHNNKGRKGGAVALGSNGTNKDTAWFNGCEFYDNNGWECGSSIIFIGGQNHKIFMNNCVVHDEDGANAFWCQGPTVWFNNSTIVNNTPNNSGPVNYMSSGAMIFYNCIIRNNSGKEFESQVSSTPGNIKLEYCNIRGGYTGTGNFDNDPSFIPNTYRLSNSSTSIGKGGNSNIVKTDKLGNPRPFPSGSNPDLGAYENAAAFPSPELVTTEGGDKKITVAWTQSNFTGLNKYKLYRSTQPISDTATMGVVVDTLDSKTFIFKDSGLTNLTRYYYRIKSINSLSLESGFSNELSAIPNTPPSSVDSVSVQNGPRLNYISWLPSKSSPVKYKIYRGLANTSLKVIVDSTSNLNFLDTGLTSWETYYYAIRAIDSVGVPSAYSEVKLGVPDNIWWVSTSGKNSNFGSKDYPLQTINAGIQKSNAAYGDTIYINKGKYVENIDYLGKNILVSSLYKYEGDTSLIRNTIIDGGNKGNVIDVKRGESYKARLAGLSITNGYAGIVIDNQSKLSIRDINLYANGSFYAIGSAIIVGWNSSINGEGVLVENHKGNGGLINVGSWGSYGKFNNLIVRNNSNITNAAYVNDLGSSDISNALFYNNGDVPCIGMMNTTDGFNIINSTLISGKAAPIRVLYNNIQSTQIGIANTILQSSHSGKQIEINNHNPSTSISLRSVVIPGGISNIEKLINTTIDTGSKNTILDLVPLFKDANKGIYSLRNNSLMIGQGVDGSVILGKDTLVIPNTDIEGNPRPFPSGSNPDLGAYENAAAFPSPELVTTEGGDKKITVAWTQSSFTGLNKYKLYRSTKPISDTATVDVVVDTLDSKTLNYTDSGLTNLTRYYYRIKSINSSGLESGFSNELSAIPNTPPDAPDSIRVVNGPHRLQLTWPASATSGVTYQLLRKSSGKADYLLSGISSTFYEDTTIEDGIVYSYSVAAVDSVKVRSLYTKSKFGYSRRIWFVSSTGKDSVGCGYETKPIKTVQYAINRSTDEDTVLLEKGIYKENVIYNGHEIVLTSRFALTQNYKDRDSTILDGDQAGCVVRIKNSEGNNTELSGLVIQNGYSNAGAGIYATANRIKFKSLIVRNNTAAGDIDGGGAYIMWGKIQIDDCEFYGNKGRKGGAIALGANTNDTAWITNCNFHDNDAWEAGSAFHFVSGNANKVFVYNTIIHNEDGQSTIWCQTPIVRFIQCAIVNNTPSKTTPVNYMYSGTLEYYNCIIRNPGKTEFGSLVSSNPGNIKVQYSNVLGGYTGTGNMDMDPLFVSGTYQLSNASPMIGKGGTGYSIKLDKLGNPRPWPIGSNPDLGAYESPFEVPGPYIDSVRTLGDTMFTHINLLPTNKADYFYLRYQDTSGQITFDSTKLSSTNNHYIVKNFSLKNGRIYKIQADLNKSTIGPSNVRSAALMVKPDMYSPSYQATMVDTNQSLKWWPSPYAEKYRVQLSSNSDFTSTLIDNIVAVDSFKPKGLKLNRTYYWRTLSMDSLGRSHWSDVFTYQTEIQKARIDSLRYTPTKVKLHFSLHDTFNIAKFYVYRDTSPNAFNLIDSVSATARVFVDSLVKPGLRYYYRLRVVNKQNVIGDFGVERALNILNSPTLIDPKNEQDSVFWTTTFAWSKTSKAQYSEFELYQIGGDDSLINRRVLNEDTLTVASLKQNRYHVWRIRALDSCGQSEWSDTFRMQTKVAPTNITKVQSYVAHIDLSWQLADTFNVKDYVIYRDTVVSGLTVLDSITYTGTTYRDSSLAAGVRYYYQIRVRNRQGAMSDPSPMRSASVLEAPILVKPVNMKTNESRNPVHDWQKVKYATKYRVKVSSDSQMVNLLANTLQTPNSFALSNLKYSTYYFWKVRAEDSTGYGAWSESRLYQTEVQTPILKMLSSKGNLVEINWELKDTINAASFLIFRDTVVNPQMVIDSISSSERSYFDTNITTNTRYYYSIVLKNRQHVKGSKSNVKAINVMREPTLIVPGDNKPNITTSLIFDWSSEKFANSYSIHVSTDSLFTNRVKDTSSSFSSVTMGVFKRNTNYFWRVRCEDTLGYGLWSKTFKYQTELDVPELTFIATENRRSTIKWVLNDTTNYANLNGFYIYRDTLPGAEKLIDSVNSDVLSYVDTTVKVSTMYYYRLKTRNRQNITSDFSNERRAAILNEPILITPYDSTFENKLVSTFKWIKQRYATDYQLQISYDSIVSKPFIDLTVTDMDSMKLTLSRKNYFYYWKVRSIDSLGVSGWSNINKFQTELTRPSIDTTISGNKKIRIYWTSSDTQNIKNYRIYRDTTTSKPSFIASISNQFNKQNYDYLDSGLVNFKTYYYWISAVNYQNIESQKSLFKFNSTFNLAPVAQIIEDTAFEAVGRVDRVKRYFNQDGAIDKDGWIDSTVWFIDNIRVSNHDTLKYLFRQGTTKVSAVVYDNDLATDTNTFYVDQLTYRKNFRAGIVAGISIYDKNEIYVADTSLNSFGLGEVVRIDSMGNTTFNYLVSQRIRTTPSFDFNGNMYLTNGVNLSTFTKTGAPYLNEIALGGLSFITPTIDSILGMVYIGLSNKKFFAIDASHGGKIKWDFTTDAPISAPAVVTAGRKLIFPDVSGNLYGFDITYSYKPKTGDDPNWKWTSNSDSILLAPAIDTFENIIVGTTSGKLMKLSFDTLGKINTKWSVNLKSRITTSAVIDAYGHVYVGCENGLLYCVKSSNGDTIWSFQTGARIVSTPTLNENSRLYVANINGDVFALDSAKRIMWYYNGHEPVVSHLAYLEGQLYISTLKGSLYGIYDNGIIEDITSAKNQVTKRSKILDVPKPIWGTFQGNNRRTGVQDWIFRLVPNKQADENSIILFPNPTENSFVIESLFGINKIEFYENQGRLAYQSIFNKSTRVSFNNLDLSPGIYILKIFTERGTVIKRLIITGN